MSLKTGVRTQFTVLLVIALLCTGFLVRVFGGVAVLTTDLVYISGNKPLSEVPDSPEAVARLFYLSLDSGDYETAWQYSLEPDWKEEGATVNYWDNLEPASSTPMKWTSKSDFINRMNSELGKSGYGIKLNNVDAVRAEAEAADGAVPFTLPDADEVVPVTVSGHLLGACTIYGWEKNLFVARSGEDYKVLLEGTKEENTLFYQTWISDMKKISDLKKGTGGDPIF